MSAFGIGTNTQKANAGEIRGFQKEVGCFCWFTSQGKSIPRIIKFIDDNGELQTVYEVLVKHMEPKNYSGIPSIEYLCSFSVSNIIYDVKLIFFQSECKWVMNFI
jgi:hypothetical protein